MNSTLRLILLICCMAAFMLCSIGPVADGGGTDTGNPDLTACALKAFSTMDSTDYWKVSAWLPDSVHLKSDTLSTLPANFSSVNDLSVSVVNTSASFTIPVGATSQNGTRYSSIIRDTIIYGYTIPDTFVIVQSNDSLSAVYSITGVDTILFSDTVVLADSLQSVSSLGYAPLVSMVEWDSLGIPMYSYQGSNTGSIRQFLPIDSSNSSVRHGPTNRIIRRFSRSYADISGSHIVSYLPDSMPGRMALFVTTKSNITDTVESSIVKSIIAVHDSQSSDDDSLVSIVNTVAFRAGIIDSLSITIQPKKPLGLSAQPDQALLTCTSVMRDGKSSQLTNATIDAVAGLIEGLYTVNGVSRQVVLDRSGNEVK